MLFSSTLVTQGNLMLWPYCWTLLSKDMGVNEAGIDLEASSLLVRLYGAGKRVKQAAGQKKLSTSCPVQLWTPTGTAWTGISIHCYNPGMNVMGLTVHFLTRPSPVLQDGMGDSQGGGNDMQLWRHRGRLEQEDQVGRGSEGELKRGVWEGWRTLRTLWEVPGNPTTIEAS